MNSDQNQPTPARLFLFSLITITLLIGALEFSAGAARKLLRFAPHDSGGGLYIRHETRQWAMKPNYSGVMNRITSVTTNELGFRSPPLKEYLDAPRRLLVLGDSVAFGWGVSAEESWPHILQGLLNRSSDDSNRVGVMNTGTVGYGTCHEASVLREQGSRLRPDLIVLQFFPNDLFENYSYQTRSKLNRFLERSNLYELGRDIWRRLRGSETYSRRDRLAEEDPRKLSRRIARKDFGTNKEEAVFSDRHPEILSAGWRKTARALSTIDSLTTALHADLYVVAFPSPKQVEGVTESTVFQDSLETICKRFQTPFLDLLDILAETEENYFGTHPSAVGHKKAAETIAGLWGVDLLVE